MRSASCLVTCAAAALLPLASSAAELVFSFETGNNPFATGIWSPSGPATNGVASVQANPTAGGWTWSLAATFGGGDDFNANGIADNLDVSAIAASGTGVLTFDIIIDHGTSFNQPPVGTWHQINLATNSANGWTQFGAIVDGWHSEFTTGTNTYSFSYAFSQLNWTTGLGWYQINLGSNSDGDKPVRFYVDNVRLSDGTAPIPEPSTYAALAGLAGLGFALWRRRARQA